MNEQALDIYCATCVRSVPYKQLTEILWTCVNCESQVSLPKHARFIQLFQDAKIKLMTHVQVPKMVEAYAKCQLKIDESVDNLVPVSLAKQSRTIRVNPATAKYISNSDLEKMFLYSFYTAIAPR